MASTSIVQRIIDLTRSHPDCKDVLATLISALEEERREQEQSRLMLTRMLRQSMHASNPASEELSAVLLEWCQGPADLMALEPFFRQASPPPSQATPTQAPADVAPPLTPRREVSRMQHALEKEVAEMIRQNRAATEVMARLLDRLQLAEEVPAAKLDSAAVTEELERAMGSFEQLHERLVSTREELRAMSHNTSRLNEELSRVRALSLTDELTGLANRRAFMRDLEAEIGRAERQNTDFCLAIIDLDHFKAINDRYGHPIGDDVLRLYAQHALGVLRKQDVVARYGGEEFVAILPNTTLDGTQAALAKLREQTARLSVQTIAGTLNLPTFSAGVAQYHEGDGAETMIRRADAALYRAKRTGRNRTEIARHTGLTPAETTENTLPGHPSCPTPMS